MKEYNEIHFFDENQNEKDYEVLVNWFDSDKFHNELSKICKYDKKDISITWKDENNVIEIFFGNLRINMDYKQEFLDIVNGYGKLDLSKDFWLSGDFNLITLLRGKEEGYGYGEQVEEFVNLYHNDEIKDYEKDGIYYKYGLSSLPCEYHNNHIYVYFL